MLSAPNFCYICLPCRTESALTREQIAQRVKELGAQITRDFAGQSVIFVGVLKGAAIFLSDLAREVDLDSTFDFIGVTVTETAPTQPMNCSMVGIQPAK